MTAVRSFGDELPGSDKYWTLAAASNGRLYAAPSSASRVLEIDPAAGTTRLIGNELPGDNKYTSLAAVSARSRHIYAAPSDALRALHIDLDAERLSWTMFTRQIGKHRIEDVLNLFEGEPGLWILAKAAPPVTKHILSFV